jgi:hypothetical protein
MTGANRLLIGLGWPAVVVSVWLVKRQRSIALDRSEALELACLAIATVYRVSSSPGRDVLGLCRRRSAARALRLLHGVGGARSQRGGRARGRSRSARASLSTARWAARRPCSACSCSPR